MTDTKHDPDIVTRFAPSPTGFLHIGGARTALFNWAFARHHDGQFLLRIEDTDRARSTDAAIAAILDGLNWLGLTPDAPPTYQHQNAARHRAVAEQLLADGHAYKCYCTPEEIQAMRDKANAAGLPPRYDGTCRNRDNIIENKPFAVRFKAPQEGTLLIGDKVQGDITFANEQMDDLILLRSDGTPTYMLSVVVDDHDMRVSHIIRGDDHLTNAARQAQIYQALGWDMPVFAHTPLIHGADGAKLSKRHGALGVEAYQDMGYLPEAMCNYLARLGWSHGDDEIFTTDQLVELFGLEAIGRSPARFDMDKLDNLNGHHIRLSDDNRLVELTVAMQPDLKPVRDRLAAVMPVLKTRAKSLHELADNAAFLALKHPIIIDVKAAKKLTDQTRAHLAALLPVLDAVKEWNLTNIETAIGGFIEENDLKLGDVAPALRAALTGRTHSVGIFEVIALLDKSEALVRIRHQTMHK